jgi:hypothetical protein
MDAPRLDGLPFNLKYRLLKTSRALFLKPVQPTAPPRALQAGKDAKYL